MNLNEIKNTDTELLRSCLLSKLKGRVRNPDEAMLTAAYMVIMQHLIPEKHKLMESVCIPETSITPEIREIMNEYSGGNTDDFVSLLLFSEFDYSVPAGISEMMLRLCDKHEKAAAVVCGDVSSVRDALMSEPSLKKITLYDAALSDTAKMRADVITRVTDSVIDFRDAKPDKKHSLIISNYLLSDRPYTRIEPVFSCSEKIIPFDTDNISYEWKIHSQIIQMLSADGKAAVVTTVGAVSNKHEEYIRKFFIEEGLVNTVIALPPKLFGYTPIRSVMILFSFGNRKIKFTDAGNAFTSGRRINTLLPENITDILENSKYTELDTGDLKISENGYSLDPLAYLSETPVINNAVPFGQVMLSVTRGMQLNADDIDELEVLDSSLSCGYRYLKISDINDGLIGSELPYLRELPEGAEKYCTSYGDIIISKTGKPVKAAVVGYDDERILVTGNMYIIRPDTGKINPYFLLAFLTGSSGRESLVRISGGSTLCTISLSALKNMMIPLPDMKTQTEIADSFKEKLKEFAELSELLKQKKEELRKIYR